MNNTPSNAPYIPDLGIVYPDEPDGRMVEFKVLRERIVDENYPFLDKSFKARFWKILCYVAIFVLVFSISPIRFGYRVKGRKILRKHRKLLKNGAITVANHMQRWDFLFALQAVRYRRMYFPVWKEQLNGPDEGRIRAAGGIPIPDDISTMKSFNKAFDELVAKKKWIHIFPEGSRFDYFHYIRPFKKGAFTMAQRYNLPVIPIAFSYRKPVFPYTILNSIRSLTGRQKLPMITACIGEPIQIDPSLPRKEAILKLRKECHEAVVRLAGIQNNKFPAEGD
jgi:1-acyl-sn-glycerol-3-phosphate acyltransferase